MGMINHTTEYIPHHEHESHDHSNLEAVLNDVRADLGEIKGLLARVPETLAEPIEEKTSPIAEAVPVPEPVRQTIALPAEAIEKVDEKPEEKSEKSKRHSYHRRR